MTPNAGGGHRPSAPLVAGGNALTLAECRVILERCPKGHPARKAAFHDIRVLGGYARALSREAAALYRARPKRRGAA